MGKPIMELVADGKGMLGRDDVLIVDVLDGTEVAATGKVKGAVNASRGGVKFQADPTSPMNKSVFFPDMTVIVNPFFLVNSHGPFSSSANDVSGVSG